MDKKNFNIDNDRLIVNIDSLSKLIEFTDYYFGQKNIKEFDLLILDEICSLLNHFESDLMKDKKQQVYKIFEELIKKTQKIIALDGDFSNRENYYLKDVVGDNSVEIYENEYKGDKYHFDFTKDENKVYQKITNDLSNKKKVVFVSTSETKALEFKEYFINKKYKVFCITGKSESKIKKELINLENRLRTNNVELFIYSPTITVGNDFNFKYFDKQYGFICLESCNGRDYMQMCFRIRQLANKNIRILVDKNIILQDWANFYSMEEIIIEMCSVLNLDKNNLTTYYKLRMFNKWEKINSENYMLPVIIHYIKKKGYTYNIDTNKDKNIKVEKIKVTDKLLNDIINSKSLNADEFNELLKKQNIDGLNYNEKCQIDKYMHCFKFSVDINKLDLETLKTIYEKYYIVENNRNVLNYEDNGVTFDEKIENKQCEKIRELIIFLGFEIVDNKVSDILLSKEDLKKSKPKIVKLIDKEFTVLFNMKKMSVSYVKNILGTDEDSNKKYLGFLNTLLDEYGFVVKMIQGSSKERGKIKPVYNYKLIENEIINKLKK